jgi:hypothetical protein
MSNGGLVTQTINRCAIRRSRISISAVLALPLLTLLTHWAKRRIRCYPLLIIFSLGVMNKWLEYWCKCTDMGKPTYSKKTCPNKSLNYKKITNWTNFEIGAPQWYAATHTKTKISGLSKIKTRLSNLLRRIIWSLYQPSYYAFKNSSHKWQVHPQLFHSCLTPQFKLSVVI